MSSPATSANRPWALTLLFLVVTLNLLDRQVINILAQDIKVDLVLTDAELGLLTGTAFGLFKAVVGLPVAWCADRLDRSKLIAAMLAMWSVCTMLCGMAGSFATLFLARVGVGVGESGGQPTSTSLVRDYFPGRPTSALALMMAGNPFGVFLAFLVGGFVAAHWGWRWAFFVAGAPGPIVAVMILLTLKDRREAQQASAQGTGLWPSIGAILRQPRFLLLLAATASSLTIVNSITAWLPAYFIRVHGFGTQQMGEYGAFAIGLGGGLGTLSGLLCERFRRRLALPESMAMLASLALIVPALFVLVSSGNSTIALGSYFLLNFCAFVWLAPTTRLIQDAVEPRQRALAMSLCGGAGFMFSLVLVVPAIGWISDWLAPTSGARSIGDALCLVLPVVVGSGWFCHWLLLQKLRRQQCPA